MKQISAIARLQDLPAVFRGADLTVRFQWTSKTASQYLYLWKKRGLVDGLGGHSDVFVNLLASKQPDWEKALQAAMPSAVIVGIEALRRARWTTQVPQRPNIAVDVTQSVFSTERFEISPRDHAWFAATRAGILNDRNGTLPQLAPAWALADLLRESEWGSCGLWPDDIEWSEVTPVDEAQWRGACEVFKMPDSELHEMMESSRSHGLRR